MNEKYPKAATYSILACVIGYAVCDKLTGIQQNGFGNWLELLGQYILTNGTFIQNEQLTRHGDDTYSHKLLIKQLINDLDLVKKELEKINIDDILKEGFKKPS